MKKIKFWVWVLGCLWVTSLSGVGLNFFGRGYWALGPTSRKKYFTRFLLQPKLKS